MGSCPIAYTQSHGRRILILRRVIMFGKSPAIERRQDQETALLPQVSAGLGQITIGGILQTTNDHSLPQFKQPVSIVSLYLDAFARTLETMLAFLGLTASKRRINCKIGERPLRPYLALNISIFDGTTKPGGVRLAQTAVKSQCCFTCLSPLFWPVPYLLIARMSA